MKIRPSILRYGLLLLCLLMVRRICSVIYSSLTTNALYSSGWTPVVLFYLCDFLHVLFLSVVFFSMVSHFSSLASDGRITNLLPLALIPAVLFLTDALIAWTIDLAQNNIRGREIVGLLNALTISALDSFFVVGAFFVLWLVTGKRKDGEPARHVGVGVLVLICVAYLVMDLLILGWDILDFLAAYHYPTAAEILALLRTAVIELLEYGVLLTGLGIGLWFLFKKDEGEA